MGQQNTILIVDDDATGRAALEALLLNQGFTLATAANGRDALIEAERIRPDIILLDVMMPEMDGFEVCRRIRSTPGLADTVVILLTALDDRDSRLTGIEAGADDFISKPYDRVELRARLRVIARLNRTGRLSAERANFAQVVDLSPNGLMIVDESEIIRLANPAMCRLLDLESTASVVNLPLAHFGALGMDNDTMALLRGVLSGKQHIGRFETTLMRSDGAHVPVEADIGTFVWNSRPAAQIIVRDITERKQAEALAQRQLERLAALRSIDAAITSSLDLNLTLGVILDLAVYHLQVDAVAVLLRQPFSQMLEYAAVRGVRKTALPQENLHVNEGNAAYVSRHRRLLRLPDPGNAEVAHLRSPLGSEYPTYYAMPLIIKGQVEGVLELFYRTAHTADTEWLHFVEALSGQTAVAIEHANLFHAMQRSHAKLVRAYDTTLKGWANALELRDKETEGHSQRVTDLTVRLARQMGFDEADLVHIRRGALLHDIGKMGIPDSILFKPSQLSDEEWAVMRRHPQIAYDLLVPVSYLRPALDIPLYHHERWDGTGYPKGLAGAEIPLAARIFAVVDVWDALRHDRPYRQAWPAEKVRDYIRSLSGTHFDPQVVEAFIRLDLQEHLDDRDAILIVDDDAGIVHALRRSLQEQYIIFTASSGDEALDVLAREEIAVIITDQRMPGYTGVQLLERARYVRPDALGIICSGYMDSAALSEALNLGTVRGFIQKPWTMADLHRRVSEVAQQYRKNKQAVALPVVS